MPEGMNIYIHTYIRTYIHMSLYLFTAIGFPPGGSGRSTCTKIGKRQLYTKGETIHKIEKNRKQENEHNNIK
jgi:hypothetical protein